MDIVKIIYVSLLVAVVILNTYFLFDYSGWRKKRRVEVGVTTIQIKRGTAKIWKELNPVLEDGELGWDKTNNLLKIGDGETSWNDLPYLSAYMGGEMYI